jgi:hypothetical protein
MRHSGEACHLAHAPFGAVLHVLELLNHREIPDKAPIVPSQQALPHLHRDAKFLTLDRDH